MPQVNGESVEAGCYVDGHWGQYGSSRVLRIADDFLGTSFFDNAQSDAMADADTSDGADVHGIMTDELSFCEAVAWHADEAENALNDATTDGYWTWEDGEFYLIDGDWETNNPF